MRKLLVLFIVLLTLLFSYINLAQEMGSFRRNIKKEIPVKLMEPTGTPLAAGTYTIGSGGDFPTIDSAFNKLSVDGITGEVTLELLDTLYIAPTTEYGFLLNGPIPGADENNRVNIIPNLTNGTTIEGNGGAVLSFINTSYLTLGTGGGILHLLEIHALQNAQFTRNDCVVFLDNSDHNIIRLVDFISEDYTRDCAGIIFQVSSTSTPFSPDSNMIAGNRFKKAGIGIYLEGYANAATGNVIRVNSFGWGTDGFISGGIHLFHNKNAIIENNTVHNLGHHSNSSFFNDIIRGINAYWSDGTIIRNNLVHNIDDNSSYYGAAGILLSGSVGEFGNNNLVYNNMIYDIRNSSGQTTSCAAGINIWNQNNPKIYFNSVYLDNTGSSPSRSSAFNVAGQCSNIELKNNIFVNTKNEPPYCASAVYNYSSSNLISDYNDLYYTPNAYNCLVRATSDYLTLADWQATDKDLNSITEMPNFLSGPAENWVLNIDESIPTNLEKGATPIVGINDDFDGDLRNVSNPDIGADEFNGTVVPVELTSFTASANAGEVILNWSTATELNNQGFEVQRKFGSNDFVTIGSVEGNGTTTSPNNYTYVDKLIDAGKYFYRLKQIDYGGKYEYSQVVEVNWSPFTTYKLEQNYPNPFNPTTTIGFGIPEKGNVRLSVLNILGEEKRILLNEETEAGYHSIDFNADDLPSGVYFYRMTAGNYIASRKMLLLK